MAIYKSCSPYLCMYRLFIKYCVFSLKFCDFSELCQFCCRADVLPAWCVYTHWNQGKTEKGKSSEYFKIFQKTQYLMNTLYNVHVTHIFPHSVRKSSSLLMSITPLTFSSKLHYLNVIPTMVISTYIYVLLPVECTKIDNIWITPKHLIRQHIF